jgi:nucleotide-binding universal stress UspA family protein
MTTNYRIVVGVDGSAGARAALRWAVREAHFRGGAVHVVNAWRSEFRELRHADTALRLTRFAEEMLEREVESLPLYQLAGVPVAREAFEGKPADVLVRAARDADLLVLGSHGHSRLLHQVLGSVTEDCIRKADCPVVVLPAGIHMGYEQSVAARRDSAYRAIDLPQPAMAIDPAR